MLSSPGFPDTIRLVFLLLNFLCWSLFHLIFHYPASKWLSTPGFALGYSFFFSIYSLSPGISFAFMVGNTTYLLIILELIFPACFGPLSYNLENLTAHISTWMSNRPFKLNMFAVELPSLTSHVPHPCQPPAQSCALFSLSKCSTSKSRDRL